MLVHTAGRQGPFPKQGHIQVRGTGERDAPLRQGISQGFVRIQNLDEPATVFRVGRAWAAVFGIGELARASAVLPDDARQFNWLGLVLLFRVQG